MKKIFVMTAVLGLLFACKKSTDATSSVDCGSAAKSFVADVKPIIQASCAFDSDCHGSNSSSGPGSLLSYAAIFNARLDIRLAVSSGNMPKGSSLPASEKNAIICWIDNGAPNN